MNKLEAKKRVYSAAYFVLAGKNLEEPSFIWEYEESVEDENALRDAWDELLQQLSDRGNQK